MFNFWQKFIRVVLILIPIFVFGWLLYQKLTPGGLREAVYDIKRETPFISKLYPKDRVSEVKKEGRVFYREPLDEPIYFDLKPHDQFEKATVVIQYKFSGDGPLKFGGLVDKKNWIFYFIDMPRGESWQEVIGTFDLVKLAMEGDKYRFMISAPGFSPGELVIGEIRVIFERKPMTTREITVTIWEVGRNKIKNFY